MEIGPRVMKLHKDLQDEIEGTKKIMDKQICDIKLELNQ